MYIKDYVIQHEISTGTSITRKCCACIKGEISIDFSFYLANYYWFLSSNWWKFADQYIVNTSGKFTKYFRL